MVCGRESFLGKRLPIAFMKCHESSNSSVYSFLKSQPLPFRELKFELTSECCWNVNLSFHGTHDSENTREDPTFVKITWFSTQGMENQILQGGSLSVLLSRVGENLKTAQGTYENRSNMRKDQEISPSLSLGIISQNRWCFLGNLFSNLHSCNPNTSFFSSLLSMMKTLQWDISV